MTPRCSVSLRLWLPKPEFAPICQYVYCRFMQSGISFLNDDAIYK